MINTSSDLIECHLIRYCIIASLRIYKAAAIFKVSSPHHFSLVVFQAMNTIHLPSLSDLWLDYNGDADRCRLTLPPLRPRPRPATPPPPIPAPLPRLQPRPRRATVSPPPIAATAPARRDRRRGGSKAKAEVKGKSGTAQGRAARRGSSPPNTTQHFTSMDAELNLSSEPWRIFMPLYEFIKQPDGSLVRSEWIS
ncbi:hypothetical protein JB92DRAFT_3146608 [Gautieria morchelliformis]|nr:hypothetical protein JB92DRAFT_3146608 [Gautieria morchelliformis]